LNQKKLRIFKGRSSKGIKGLELAPNDEIVSLSIIDQEKNKNVSKLNSKTTDRYVLSITENGYGKKHLILIIE